MIRFARPNCLGRVFFLGDGEVDDDRFWVKSLTLENYRCFEKTELGPFDPHFNLLVGANGTGKSSVLLALANLFRQLGTPGANPGDPMTAPSDLRSVISVGTDGLHFRQSALAGKFLAELQYGGRIWSAFEPVGSGVPYNSGVYPLAGVHGEIIRDPANKHDYFRPGIDVHGQIADLPLPLIVNYPVLRKFRRARSLEYSQLRMLSSRLSGLTNWRDAGTDIDALSEWIKNQTLVDLQQHAISKATIDQTNAIQVVSQLNLVREAMVIALEDVVSIEYEGVRSDIVVQFVDGNRKDFSTMSDGQRSFIGLVTDIAQRACALNAPVLGRRALTETPGLVLIDEIDLHLHPKWQRHVVGALKRIFPKIQFFATTHSPQVIGEARPDEIVLLTADGQQKRPMGSYGMESGWVLECVMEAEGRDPEIAKRVSKLFELIDDGDFDEARTEIENLRKEIGPLAPDVIGAESYMWRIEHEADEAAE